MRYRVISQKMHYDRNCDETEGKRPYPASDRPDYQEIYSFLGVKLLEPSNFEFGIADWHTSHTFGLICHTLYLAPWRLLVRKCTRTKNCWRVSLLARSLSCVAAGAAVVRIWRKRGDAMRVNYLKPWLKRSRSW